MNIRGMLSCAVVAMLAPYAAQAADAPFKNCPFTGVMPDFAAKKPPQWRHWDPQVFTVKDGDGSKDITAYGAICDQDYTENAGKDPVTPLEVMENFKEQLRQEGAEIARDAPGNPSQVIGHLSKDGKEYWIRINSGNDGYYSVRVLSVEPFKRSLLPPSGNDYRLIGHMPGFIAGTPTKKHFDEVEFGLPAAQSVRIRGAVYGVEYRGPAKDPEQVITTEEIVENYRQALKDLNAEFLYDAPGGITARVDDHGQTVWLKINDHSVVTVEEKPFQLSIQPPTADVMKDKLDKEGHIALYVNFDFAKATLKPDAAPVIAQVVELLKRNPDLKVSIDGHTDNIGAHDYNMKLSQDRAASVAAAIAAAGVDAARLKSAGYGPDKPIASNDTDEGRAKNRRVELVKAP
jgi:outer membrane protein OmpA-like peptidoglycan-associated protein